MLYVMHVVVKLHLGLYLCELVCSFYNLFIITSGPEFPLQCTYVELTYSLFCADVQKPI